MAEQWQRNETEAHISLLIDWYHFANKTPDPERAASLEKHLIECGCDPNTITFTPDGFPTGAIAMGGDAESQKHADYRTKQREQGELWQCHYDPDQ